MGVCPIKIHPKAELGEFLLIESKGATECGAERDMRLSSFPPGERSPPFI